MAEERVVAIIEARMGASRLPGKSMRPLAGAPLVQRVAERIRRARSLHEVVVATSVSPKDDVLAEHMTAAGFAVHRGSEDDVLGRILGAAQAHRATVHVQCWGDCPLADPTEIDRVVEKLLATGADLAGNGLGKDRTLPYGLDVLAFTVKALEEADRATKDTPYHREHGTTYIYENPDRFRVERCETPSDIGFPKLDLTINTEDDYAFITAIYDALYASKPGFDVRDVIAFVRSRPELLAHKNAKTLAER